MILPYKGIYPKIAKTAFIAENAVIIGDVEIGEYSNVWYNVVIRGDVEKISIGKRTNIQDGTIIHVNRKNGPTIIGDNVTIGHLALLHACILEDESFVGMGAKVIDYARVESGAMVGAGSLVTPNKIVKSRELWTGIPAKRLRDLSEEEYEFIKISAQNYVDLASDYLKV
jgi:carbonic anhydrase/acetyltransferase-like protein (isoleucine patch superfamily)